MQRSDPNARQVLTKGEFLDYYDVSGCYILKPASYFIWEEIQTWFNKKIKSIGVKNCAFPLFVSEDVLQREKAVCDLTGHKTKESRKLCYENYMLNMYSYSI